MCRQNKGRRKSAEKVAVALKSAASSVVAASAGEKKEGGYDTEWIPKVLLIDDADGKEHLQQASTKQRRKR
jgi:hypothetical protein